MSCNDRPHGCGDFPPPECDDLLERINDKLGYLCLVVSIWIVFKFVAWVFG